MISLDLRRFVKGFIQGLVVWTVLSPFTELYLQRGVPYMV